MSYDGLPFSPDDIDNHLARYEKIPFGIEVHLSEKLAQDGYGSITINGKESERAGIIYDDEFCIKSLLVPLGGSQLDYDRDYSICFTGFKGVSGEYFEPYTLNIHTEKKRVQDMAYAEHDAKALEAAREGIILLKNDDNVLPVKEDNVLNCFGAGQFMYRITATGASLINPRWRPDFMQAVGEHSSFSLNEEVSALYRELKDTVPDGDILARAKEKSDMAFIFLSRHSGEMNDNRPVKGQYYLTDDEDAMIAAVSSVFEKTVAVLTVGHPIDMRWIKKYGIKAVLYVGFAGMLSSYALMEILDGRTNPSAKLPFTITWDYHDDPVNSNFPTLKEGEAHPGESGKGVHIYYEEDIYMGYRYFDTFQKPVAFPFGHGLSYTVFSLEPVCFKRTENGISTEIKVTNTGKVPGKEVVQLYLSAPDGKLEKPAHVLIGFEKTALLAPGESQNLTLSAGNGDMASYDESTSSWIFDKGEYFVFAGTGLSNLLSVGSFSVDDFTVLKKVKSYAAPVEGFKRLTKASPTVDGSRSMYTPVEERIAVSAPRTEYEPSTLAPYNSETITWEMLKKDETLLDSFVSQMSDDEQCQLNICAGNHFNSWDKGAGYTPDMPKYGLTSMDVTDANAGIHFLKPNIGFPASSVIAASFNKDIAYTVGSVVGAECKENNMVINLGPGMNIQRAKLNGRHPEYFSEDPFLAGTLAGMHGMGLEDSGVGCCYKHMFCNNSDTCRKSSHSIVSERAMREIYLKAFEVAFRVHKPTTVMTSYNAVNGLYPAENAALLQGLLRDEWGFDGFVMCDWGSYKTIDLAQMVKAGNCWICDGGPEILAQLKEAVADGKVSRAVLQNNVKYLVKIFLRWSK